MEKKNPSSVKFYVLLIIILSLSILMLSLSYSKESGNTYQSIDYVNDNSLKVVFSDGNKIAHQTASLKNYDKAKEYYYSVTNEDKKNASYYELDVICEKCYNDNYYYSIDGGEPKKISSFNIFEEELGKYGEENDHFTHSVRIFAETNFDDEISIKINKYDKSQLIYFINKDSNFIREKNGGSFKEAATTNYINNSGVIYKMNKIEKDNILCTIVDPDLIDVPKEITIKTYAKVVSGNGEVGTPYEVKYES